MPGPTWAARDNPRPSRNGPRLRTHRTPVRFNTIVPPFGITRRVGLVHCLLHPSAHLLQQRIGDVAFLIVITTNTALGTIACANVSPAAKSARTDSCSKATFTYLILTYFRGRFDLRDSSDRLSWCGTPCTSAHVFRNNGRRMGAVSRLRSRHFCMEVGTYGGFSPFLYTRAGTE